jgi:hypothetical protein
MEAQMRITIIDSTPGRQERWTFWISFPQVLLDDYGLGSDETPRPQGKVEVE